MASPASTAAAACPWSWPSSACFPPLAVIIPVMIMWAYLDLIDSWWGLALIYGIVTLPFAFWLMLTFLDEVPVELEEAALIEGRAALSRLPAGDPAADQAARSPPPCSSSSS